MRRTTIASRWTTPRRHYTGGWRHNPWINAVCNASQSRSATDGSPTAPIVAEFAADGERAGLADSATSPQDVESQDRQQYAATRIWENEGGNLGTPPAHAALVARR